MPMNNNGDKLDRGAMGMVMLSELTICTVSYPNACSSVGSTTGPLPNGERMR